MDEQEEKYGVPLFNPVESETIVLSLYNTNNNDEEQGDYSHTDMMEVSYGVKEIDVNEIETEGLPWQEG